MEKTEKEKKEYNRKYYLTHTKKPESDEFIDREGKLVDGKLRRIRGFTQYKNLTDEEFNDLMAKREMNALPSKTLEKRIELKLKEFSEDYDISDLKINDKLVLRALIQAILQLEDLEQYATKIREEGIGATTIASLRDANVMMSQLRKDISSMQEDLKITRKHRKGDKEQSVIAYIEDLKTRAKEFYKSAMFYVICDKCNMLLATTWFLFPEGKNKLILTCNNILGNGEKCGNIITITSKELIERKESGNENHLPESVI